MTLLTTTSRITYIGNGVVDTFAYTWLMYSDADLKVYVDNVLKTKTTHYTVSGVGNVNGGNVVFTAGNIPANGKNVLIYRDQPLTQDTDLITNGQISADTLEKQLDKLCMQNQTIKDTMIQVGKRVFVQVGSIQDIPASATTKIQLNSENYDVLNEFDAVTNYRFTPSVAGGYLIVANVRVDYLANAGVLNVYIVKNGSIFAAREGMALSATVSGHGSLSTMVELGTSDYVELFVENLTAGLVRIPIVVNKMEIARLW